MMPMGLTQNYYGVELALFGLENGKRDRPF
jgi:hypothetical protein